VHFTVSFCDFHNSVMLVRQLSVSSIIYVDLTLLGQMLAVTSLKQGYC